MTDYSKRPCRSQTPSQCPYHRNGVLAERASRTSMIALDLNDGAEAYLANSDKVSKYAELQRRVEAGDQVAIQQTRDEIAKETAVRIATGERNAGDTRKWFAPSLDEDLDPDDDTVDLSPRERETIRRYNAQARQGRPSTLAFDEERTNAAARAAGQQAGFNPNIMSPRDQRERLGELAQFDTPTEHVGTIPGFEDFKKLFGFGKKK